MIDLGTYPLGAIFVASTVIFLVAVEIGQRFGSRAGSVVNLSTVEAAMLGLLALMISFTFSMALTRFEARRDAVLNEANAIGTAALRARLLPAPEGRESLKLLRDYTQIRLDVTVNKTATLQELNVAVARSNAVQEALWSRVRSAVAKDNGMVPTGLYIQALNETFDDQEKRLTALRNRVPNIVLVALYGIAIVALGFAGYVSGNDTPRWRVPIYLTSILVAAVILLIQDLDRPGAGFISVSQQPMIDTANAIAGYSAEFGDGAPQPAR